MTSLATAANAPPPAASGRIRVMVVDDSAVIRGLVSRWIEEDPRMEVCGRFANGQAALSGIAESAPDVILLDIDMPVMDGLSALPDLLKAKPGVSVIIVSTLTRRNAEVSMKALSLGAADYIPKPETNRGITTSLDFRGELLRKVKALGAHVRPAVFAATDKAEKTESQTGARPALAGDAPPASTAGFELRPFSKARPRILAIGSSTGGPQALSGIITALTPDIADIPVVIIQHMPPTFTAILAEHLERCAARTAKEGEDGERLQPGSIYLAPGGYHMAVVERNGAPSLHIYDGPMVSFCKPAVDPMFMSLAEVYGPAALALVLTGMGHDGAEGAMTIAEAGGSVIAQDRNTSVVWGMPRHAIAAGACSAVLPLREIAPKVSALLKGGAA